MEVTAETGVKVCWGVPVLASPVAPLSEICRAEVLNDSEAAGSVAEYGGAGSTSIATGSPGVSCTSCSSCMYSSSAKARSSAADLRLPSA